VRILLGAAIGFVFGGLVGLLFGWVQTNGTHGPTQLVALLKAWAAGATSGTTLGAAVGMLTAGAEHGKRGKE
jgi:NhaP-type Na+/H+ or K+/H+ antiporter